MAIYLENQLIKPTIFPDRCSQIWQLELNKKHYSNITWFFENEAELFHLTQLVMLLNSKNISVDKYYIPYLPYARQDKFITNNSTFAITPFLVMLGEILKDQSIFSIDVHNPISVKGLIHNLLPIQFVSKAIEDFKADIVVYPDKGARNRYAELSPLSFIYMDKERNQLTGEITGLKLAENFKYIGSRALIWDDLSDGGRTFIETAKVLKSIGIQDIALYITHGIFSKGIQVLLDAGINKIYTTNSFQHGLETSEKIIVFDVKEII